MTYTRWLTAALLSAVLLSGCSDTVTLKYENGQFRGPGGLAYLPAEGNYEPAEVGEAYAFYKKGNITLYRIGDEDPTQWLTEAYAGGATTVFHDASITLPTLSEFGADTLLICEGEVKTVVAATVEDQALIDEAIRLFTEGEACEWPLLGAVSRFDLKFLSPTWPQITMNLIYGEFPEGEYLYERASGRCVRVDGLFDAQLHPDEVQG